MFRVLGMYNFASSTNFSVCITYPAAISLVSFLFSTTLSGFFFFFADAIDELSLIAFSSAELESWLMRHSKEFAQIDKLHYEKKITKFVSFGIN